jgi:hypothetical protein
MVVRTHQCIEIALDRLLNEALPYKHPKLVARLSFSFKIDLGIGLFATLNESRAALLNLNQIRNFFAHDLTASLSEAQMRELINTLSPHMRRVLGKEWASYSSPVMCFRGVAAVIFYHLMAAIDRITDERLYMEAMHEVVQDTLARSPVKGVRSDTSVVDARIREKFDQLKARQLAEVAGSS